MNNGGAPRGKSPELFTDEKLYFLCQRYGERGLFFKRKFTGLLPEVFRRKLYEKKGFFSIFEFAKKLAGLSEEQTRLVLNLEKRFEQTPALKSLLIEGKVSVNKLARVVSIARPENEEFLANQVQILSKSAVETLVRDERFLGKNNGNGGDEKAIENGDFMGRNGLQKSFFEPKSLPGQTDEQAGVRTLKNGRIVSQNGSGQTLQLSPEVQQKLLELQQKGFDINNLLLEFLQKRDQEIAEMKKEVSRKILQKESQKRASKSLVGQTACRRARPKITRYIPVMAKKILRQEFGKKCSIKNCKKEAAQIHHTQRFAVFQSHDPRFLAPLCKEHHELAHSADMAYFRIKNGGVGG